MSDSEARMRAIVQQVVAELERMNLEGGQAAARLVVYGSAIDDQQARALFEQLSAGTRAAGIDLKVRRGATRYICYNCCGLRFESEDGDCPNCGESAVELPDEVAFGMGELGPR